MIRQEDDIEGNATVIKQGYVGLLKISLADWCA